MKRTIITGSALLLGALALCAAAPATASAQQVGQTVTFVGCLAQEEDDDGVEYLLEDVDPEVTTATEIELLVEQGPDLAAHVGHRVEVTGVVVADEDDAEEVDEDEPEDADENELHVRVTGLQHIAASCGGG